MLNNIGCSFTNWLWKVYPHPNGLNKRWTYDFFFWSVTKQRLHPQSVAEISRHSVLSRDRIRQCKTSSGSRHKDTDLISKTTQDRAIVCKSPFPSTGTAVSLFRAKTVQQRPQRPTSSYASIDFSCQLVANLATTASWMSVVAMVG